MEHAARQLPKTGPPAKLIVASACRVWPLSQNVGFLVSELIGQTEQRDAVALPRSRLGKFWSPEWQHVAGVVLLDYLRGVDDLWYGCTVLLNPSLPVGELREWFAHARVCWFDGKVFHWARGAPGVAHFLPAGTRLAE